MIILHICCLHLHVRTEGRLFLRCMHALRIAERKNNTHKKRDQKNEKGEQARCKTTTREPIITFRARARAPLARSRNETCNLLQSPHVNVNWIFMIAHMRLQLHCTMLRSWPPRAWGLLCWRVPGYIFFLVCAVLCVVFHGRSALWWPNSC